MKRFIFGAFARALDSIAAVGRILTGQPSGPGVTLFGYWRMMRNSDRGRGVPGAPGHSAASVAPSRTLGPDSSVGRGN
jgi:hypothetical protein